MRELMIVVAFFWWLFGMEQPLEKQALAIVQRVPVNVLDRTLPGSSGMQLSKLRANGSSTRRR
jgi:hypothetical protein